MPSINAIWRHPIKGVGAQALNRVSLSQERPLPFDRAWAILEEGVEPSDGWMKCRNFIRGAKASTLMAITAEVSETGLTLRHPELDAITLILPQDEDRLLKWLRKIYPADRPAPAKLLKSPPIGMADMSYPSVSILNTASLVELESRCGHPLDQRRFRGNLWLDGLPVWQEFNMIGKRLRIGEAELEIVEINTRCGATRANPETGIADVDTLRVLNDNWGHIDFGVYAIVRHAGEITLGDKVEIL